LKTKLRKCNKCHEEFETEIDHRGFAINTRCRKCKEKEKRYRNNRIGVDLDRVFDR